MFFHPSEPRPTSPRRTRSSRCGLPPTAVVVLQTESAGIVYDSFIKSYIGDNGFVDSPVTATVFGGVQLLHRLTP